MINFNEYRKKDDFVSVSKYYELIYFTYAVDIVKRKNASLRASHPLIRDQTGLYLVDKFIAKSKEMIIKFRTDQVFPITLFIPN